MVILLSTIGTIVHSVAAAVANGEQVDKAAIEAYATEEGKKEDVDTSTVLTDYVPMAERLVNDYVLPNMPEAVEEFVAYDMGDDVWVAGSVDAFDNGCVIDYKTYNSKTKPRTIPMGYRYQLLLYSYIYSKKRERILGMSETQCKKEYLSLYKE